MPPQTPRQEHNEWIRLLDTSGPFLSVSVMMEPGIFKEGLEKRADEAEMVRRLRSAWEEWRCNRSDLYGPWVQHVLTEVLGYSADILKTSQELPASYAIPLPQYRVTLKPDYAIVDPATKKARLLIMTVDPSERIDKARSGAWPASPQTRMAELLRGADVKLGLVTNGEEWTLVHAPRSETSGFATWTCEVTFLEERSALRAFYNLLDKRRFFGVAEDATLEALYARSALNQQEVTDQLGLQVRHAVEILVSQLDRLDQSHGRDLLRNVPEKKIYEAALTVMMRLVFLLCSEERKLFPVDDELYADNYAISTLRERLRAEADQHGEEILERHHDAWVRLLATFRMVFSGVRHQRLMLPAYGGGLFDPDRFAFLEGRLPGTRWEDEPAHPLAVNNRTVLHLLESLQVIREKGIEEARRVSFRALDVEQIGHVYEGLLDHTATRAIIGQPVLGLAGTKNQEPEIALADLERLRAEGEDKLIAYLVAETGRSEGALRNGSTKPTKISKRSKARTSDLVANADEPIAWPPSDTLHEGRLLAACNNDSALLHRVRPFAGLIRDDTFKHPVVIPGGAIYVTQGTDRRSTGTHYTPRSLTEPIVRYTLEPLVYTGPAEGLPKGEWKLRSPRELLDLKICDMAMGSGAFLVQACRYMSERLVESWEQEEARTGETLTFPEADPATGKLSERPLPVDLDERLALARRAIAERCLYGVDKNPLAVEIAKLSLWLITLDKGRPFTFVDHALKAGDSLLGLHDPMQLENFHLDPRQGELLNYDFVHAYGTRYVKKAMDRAADLRRQLEGFVVNSPRDAARKHELLREAEAATDILRTLGDLIVGAQLQVFRKEFDGNYDDLIQKWMTEDVFFALDEGFEKETRAQHRANLERHARTALANRDTFHWALEFPEVKGFHAFVGNPPFLGGLKIALVNGAEYRNLLVDYIARGAKGAADLAAYFVLRCSSLTAKTPLSTIGLVLTSTIKEGDTREVCLDSLVQEQWKVYRANSSRSWPGAASVTVTEVWLSGDWRGRLVLDGQDVSSISTQLTSSRSELQPIRLRRNEGQSFQGSNILGPGFLVSPEKAQELIRTNPNCRDVLFPYFVAEDINSLPILEAPRWVINFQNWPLERDVHSSKSGQQVASDYPECLKIVEETVKPYRSKNNDKRRREIWWQFTRPALALYGAIERSNFVLGISLAAAKYIEFLLLPRAAVFGHALTVIVSDRLGTLAVLCSSLHDKWTREFTSYNLSLPRYTPTDCFETFPFPISLDSLDAIGERYHEHRRQVMLARQEGLTKTYNRFHNPKEASDDIQALRDLHVEMDRAVLDAYRQPPGEAHIWTGFGPDDLDHGFHETKQGLRFTVSERARRELLDRLLELNHKRYAEEVAAGLHDKKKRKAKAERKAGAKTTLPTCNDLFADEEPEDRLD